MKQQNSLLQIGEVETASHMRDPISPTNGSITLTKNQFAQIMKSTSVNNSSTFDINESTR